MCSVLAFTCWTLLPVQHTDNYCLLFQQKCQTWSSLWHYMEDTWVSSRVPCSSPSPSPGWTRWLWVTPMPYVSGRNRSHRAKAHTWVRAPALRRKPKSLYPSLSVPPLSPSLTPPSTEETSGKNLKLLFLLCLLLWCYSMTPHLSMPSTAVLLCNHHHLTVYDGTETTDRLYACFHLWELLKSEQDLMANGGVGQIRAEVKPALKGKHQFRVV